MVKRLLHTGCGKKTIKDTPPGFNKGKWDEVRLDIDPEVDPDIVASITNMFEVESESCDAVFNSHTIEHLHSYEVENALSEFFRVLKPDGFLLITCPDLESASRAVLTGGPIKPVYTTEIGPVTPLDVIYGYRPSTAHYPLMAHKCGFTPKLLAQCLRAVGFKGVLTSVRPDKCDMWLLAYKDPELSEHFASIQHRFLPVG